MESPNLVNKLPEDVLVNVLCYASIADVFAIKQVGRLGLLAALSVPDSNGTLLYMDH